MISQCVDNEEPGEPATLMPIASRLDRAVVRLLSLGSDRRGVTALEYGIIASILGLTLVTIFRNFGTKLSSLFTVVGSSI